MDGEAGCCSTGVLSLIRGVQNFGIVAGFGIAFFVALLVFTEINTRSSAGGAVVLFKRGTKSSAVEGANKSVSDEEKGPSDAPPITERLEVEKALADQPKMTDVFSWQHLQYTVPIGHHEHRRLLDDVSGYVAPGKLTALMGESGAGKVGCPPSTHGRLN